MKNIILIAVIACVGIGPSAIADTTRVDARMDIVNRQLDCMSSHSSEQGVDWNDVCVTRKDQEGDAVKDFIVSKSMDEVIQEHQQIADEMLEAPVDDHEDRQQPKTVDDVYEQHKRDFKTERSLDDVIKEQEADQQKNSLKESSQKTDFSKPVQYASASTDSTVEDSQLSSQAPLNSAMSSLERDPDRNQNTSEIGFEFNKYRYVEPIFDLVDKGNLYGLYASFTTRPAKKQGLYEDIIDMYKAEIRFNYGLVDYKSNGSGTINGDHDWSLETRLLAGKDYMISPDSRLTPYLGFGYRYLDDDSSGRVSSTGANGYERESRYYYIPLGVDFTTKIAEGWMVTPNLEYDLFIQGKQVSRLSDVNSGFPDLRNKQRHGFGLRGSIKFIKVGNPMSFVFEPYIRYWHIQDSEDQTVTGSSFIVTGLEPENKTTEYGVRLGAMF